MSSERPSNQSGSPIYPGLMDTSLTWEDSYRQRARNMTRDYVNPNSNRLIQRPRRSRSADARPQYRRSALEVPGIRATSSSELTSHRSQVLNMFYPTTDETRARVTYDTTGPQFPSQLPKPIGIYRADFEQTGRSLSPPNYRESSPSWSGSRMSRTPPGMVDPYETSTVQYSSQTPNSKPQTYDYLKNSLIMFGDEESSMGTGLSEQELLQKKRRDQTTARRKAKKQRNRIVNLPSSLFPPHTSRQLQQKSFREEGDDDYYQDGHSGQSTAPLTIEQYEPPSAQISSRSLPMSPLPPAPQTPAPTRGTRGRERESTNRVVSPDPPPLRITNAPQSLQETKGWRGSMINRMRTQKSSTGRRWKIIPSLSRSRSRSQSPERDEDEARGAFPSPTRRGASVRYADRIESAAPVDSSRALPNVGQIERSGEERNASSYKSDSPSRLQLDPPSYVPPRDDYSSDDEGGSTQWNDNFEEHFPSSGDMSAEDYGNEETKQQVPASGTQGMSSSDFASRHFPIYSEIIEEFDDEEEERGTAFKPPREYQESSDAKHVPQRSLSDGAFPDFLSPTTPLTTSLTNTSSSTDQPSGIDWDSGSNYVTHDNARPAHPYSQRAEDFTTPDKWRGHPESPGNIDRSLPARAPQTSEQTSALKDELAYRREVRANALAVYAPSSRLNNPPGLDMDYYAPKRPDAPGSTSGTSDTDKFEIRGVSKTSPTSIADFPSPNVRWSDDLHQLPTPRRMTTEKPKSILRNGRIRQWVPHGAEQSSAESPTKAVRISVVPASRGQLIADHPSAVGFVDNEGNALSPINSLDGDDGSFPVALTASLFERNIPEEFQRAFMAVYAKSKSNDRSGQISTAYSDFIESVACVVIQTAVRQFHAKLKVRRMRDERDDSLKTSQQRRIQKAVAAGKLHIQSSISSRKSAGANGDIFFLAATRIQAIFRGWYARDCIAVDNYCAGIIQKVLRAYIVRKQFIAVRNGVTKFQALARRKQAYDIFATSMYCVVAIQAAFRGFLVRKSILLNTSEDSSATIQHVAATVIQAQWRCFTCEMAFLRAYEDILLVQSVARGWVTRRVIRSWIRAKYIQTSVLRDKTKTEARSSNTYTLPQGYHNHTAFMKQQLPPPVKNVHEAQIGQRGWVSSLPMNGSSTRKQRALAEDSGDGLMDMEVRHRDPEPFHQEEKKRSEPAGAGFKANTVFVRQQKGRAFVQDVRWRKGSEPTNATTVNSQRLGRGNVPQVHEPGKSGAVTPGLKSQAPWQPPRKFEKGWTKPSQHHVIGETTPFEEKPADFVIPPGVPSSSGVDSSSSVRARMAAFEQPNRKVSKTRSEDGGLRGSAGGKMKDAGSQLGSRDAVQQYSTASVPSVQSKVSLRGSASFEFPQEMHNRREAKLPNSYIRADAAVSEALSDEGVGRVDEPVIKESEPTGAASVLASWRNREKAAGVSDQVIPSNRFSNPKNAPSRGSVEKPSWLKSDGDRGSDEATHVVTMESVVDSSKESGGIHSAKSADRRSWQPNRARLSESKPKEETHVSYSAVTKGEQEQPNSSTTTNTNYAMKLRPVNQELHDEKKEDSPQSIDANTASVSTDSKPLHKSLGRKWQQKPTYKVVPKLTNSKGVDSSLDSIEAKKSSHGGILRPTEQVSREPSRLTVETGDPLKSKSVLHVEMRRKRSDAENQRVDAMHRMFLRVGLMGRQGKETISFAHTTSAQYEGKKQEEEHRNGGMGEPTASDLHAWRDIDQTQPMMRGKLF